MGFLSRSYRGDTLPRRNERLKRLLRQPEQSRRNEPRPPDPFYRRKQDDTKRPHEPRRNPFGFSRFAFYGKRHRPLHSLAQRDFHSYDRRFGTFNRRPLLRASRIPSGPRARRSNSISELRPSYD